MKLAFIGNFNAQYSTENYHKKTFERLGYEVVTFQESDTTVNRILPIALTCDLLYWTHTHGWNIGTPSEISDMFRRLKEKNIPSVGYHLDLWLGLQREKDLHSDPYWGIQHFFTVDKLMADWLNGNTQTKGYYLPAGMPESECLLGVPNLEKYPHEIIFTGSKGYHHEYPYRAELIDWLHKTYGERFAHYGGGGLPTVRGPELNNLYASAKIVIGDTLCKDFTYPYYFSDRLFEVPGRGGFMIFPDIKGVGEMFGTHELTLYELGNFEELKELIHYYLIEDSEREYKRIFAFERCAADHLYIHRIQTLLKTLGL